jgi:hypothetical protein
MSFSASKERLLRTEIPRESMSLTMVKAIHATVSVFFTHVWEISVRYVPQAPNPNPAPATSTANTLNPARKTVPFPITVALRGKTGKKENVKELRRTGWQQLPEREERDRNGNDSASTNSG